MKDKTRKRCLQCEHTMAAHAGDVRCMLCACSLPRQVVVQESFTFRDPLPVPDHWGERRG